MIEYESMLTGVTADTSKNLQLDAGVFLTDYTLGEDIVAENILGATRGGGTVSIVPVIHHVDADGIPANFKGMDRIDEITATISTTMLEVTPEAIVAAMGGAAEIESGREDGNVHITIGHTLKDSSYRTIWWLGNMSDGRLIAVKLSNAMSKEGLQLSISSKGEGTYPVSLTAHYDTTSYLGAKAPVDVYFIKKAED